VIYGGAPYAEDRGDKIVIYDDPRKASHQPAMYHDYCKRLISNGVSMPFHTYYVEPETQIRRFLFYKSIPISRRSTGNNVVSVYKDGFLIDGDKINIILASSGSGKSYLTASNPSFIDMDSKLKWPTDLSWLDSDESIFDVHVGLWQQMTGLATQELYLYNGVPSAIPKDIRHRFRFIALVELPIKLHQDRLALRKVETKSDQPTDWDIVDRNRKDLRKFADSEGVPIFPGFQSAVSSYVQTAGRKVIAALRDGKTSLNVSAALLDLLSLKGTITYPDVRSSVLTFGSHVSMRIHTNEYARYAGLTQHRWRHITRQLPQFYIMGFLGMPAKVSYTPCGNIDTLYMNGNEVSASGHMLGVFTWIAFPNSRVSGMPAVYPDVHTYLSMYMINQVRTTPSLEPYVKDIAYHRWIETLAGIIGSYYSIKILLKAGMYMKKRDAILWRLYARRAIRMIRINERTWYFNKETSRDSDPRFGPL